MITHNKGYNKKVYKNSCRYNNYTYICNTTNKQANKYINKYTYKHLIRQAKSMEKVNIRKTLAELEVGQIVRLPVTSVRGTTLRQTASTLGELGMAIHINKAEGYYRVWKEA